MRCLRPRIWGSLESGTSKTEAESLGWVFVGMIRNVGSGILIGSIPVEPGGVSDLASAKPPGLCFHPVCPDPMSSGAFGLPYPRPKALTLVPYTVDPVEKSADGLWARVCGVPSAGVPWDYVRLTLRRLA